MQNQDELILKINGLEAIIYAIAMPTLRLHKRKPCKDCPMRKDASGAISQHLGINIITASSFTCHKTKDPNRRQCAGHLIMMREENEYYLNAKELNIDLKLRGKELIMNKKDFIKENIGEV